MGTRFAKPAAVVFAISGIFPNAQLVAQTELKNIQVLYTGKLLGYARVPNVQRMQHWGWYVDKTSREGKQRPQECEQKRADCRPLYKTVFQDLAGPSGLGWELVKRIVEARSDATSDNLLLLGMGDNFAVDFFSRVAVVKDADGTERYVPKDELAYLETSESWLDLRTIRSEKESSYDAQTEIQSDGTSKIDSDNVATFFRVAGYDALVPGKHDFYFGPERLRNLARLLREPIEGIRPTTILGANLVIKTSEVEAPKERADFIRKKTRNWTDSIASRPDVKWGLPTTALPWIRKFVLKGQGAESLVDLQSVKVCQMVGIDRDREPDPATCRSLQRDTTNLEHLVFEITDSVPLRSNSTWRICVDLAKKESQKSLCEVFDVVTPFFQFPFEEMPQERPVVPGTRVIPKGWVPPYVVKDGVVIMGVVASEIATQVGALNLQWKNVRPGDGRNLDTVVSFIDPAEALIQLLDYCEKAEDCKPATTRIMMAQMPRDAAAMLNAGLKDKHRDRRFQLVIAQTDGRFSTAQEQVSYEQGHRPIVVVPSAPYDAEEKKLNVAVHKATIFRVHGSQYQYQTSAKPAIQINPNGLTPDLMVRDAVNTIYDEQVKPPAHETPNMTDRFSFVTLHAMRGVRKADIAFIQDRDLFDIENRIGKIQGTPITHRREIIRASVDGMIWKGDFVVTRTLTGTAIKATLDRSKAMKRTEDDLYSIETESGRWLRHLGLWQDPVSLTWYINGRPIDDKASYGVAMTDFLAFGDTGYPELKDTTIAKTLRSRQLEKLPRVAEVVRDLLIPSSSREDDLQIQTYLDPIKHAPPLRNPSAALFDVLRSLYHDATTDVPPGTSPEIKFGQGRPFWRVFVDKGEVGYSAYWNNQPSQVAVAKEFAGVSESGVNGVPKYAVGTAWQIEGRREWRRAHWFARTEEDFLTERTRDNTRAGTFIRSFPANQIMVETGVRVAFSSMRSLPWQGFLLAVNGTTQLVEPKQQFGLNTAKCLTKDLTADGDATEVACGLMQRTFSLPRTTRVLGKIGLRGESARSWYEVGYLFGSAWRPVVFNLMRQGEQLATCDIRDPQFNQMGGNPVDLVNCLDNQLEELRAPKAPGRLTAESIKTLMLETHGERRAEHGAFVNFNWQWKLPRAWRFERFSVDNRFRWFVDTSKDTPTDARFIERLSAGPTIAIWNSLSLKPSYSLFFYENKKVNNQLFTHLFEWKLEYRFDWHTGIPWLEALRYGRPK